MIDKLVKIYKRERQRPVCIYTIPFPNASKAKIGASFTSTLQKRLKVENIFFTKAHFSRRIPTVSDVEKGDRFLVLQPVANYEYLRQILERLKVVSEGKVLEVRTLVDPTNLSSKAKAVGCKERILIALDLSEKRKKGGK